MEYNEKNLPLAKWLIDKTNTKDYRIGNLLGMKHPKVDGDLLKIVGGRDELVRQAKVLERIPALGGEEYLHFDWREMNTDITKIDYRVEVIPGLCDLIGVIDPRERQLQAITRVCKLQEDVSGSCLFAYCNHVLEQLNKGNTKELSKAEDEEFLKCLKALADLKEPEWKRVFSSKVFEKKNDITPSKVFERIYQSAVIEALKYSPQYEEGMSDDEILAAYGILSYSQTLEWKGAVEYCMTDRNGTAIEKKIDTSLNYYGTVLNAQTLEHAVPNLRNSVEKIIVIENKANYESMEYDPKVLYIFCHGYFSPKEVRFLQMLMKTAPEEIPVHCVNLSTKGEQEKQLFVFTREQEQHSECSYTDTLGNYLYEPNASLLKAGAFRSIAAAYSVKKLHPNSHLYTSETQIEVFPGRTFRIINRCSLNKKEIKENLSDLKKANITVRNFPATVAELRKRIKLAEGGDTYLFASTLNDGQKILIRCGKV